MGIRSFQGVAPRLHPSVFVAEGAHVIGNVEIGEESSVWYNTVLRGDVNTITVGARTNIQDLTMVHVDRGSHPTRIGDDVTISPEGKASHLDGPNFYVRDGLVVIPKGAVVMSGTTI